VFAQPIDPNQAFETINVYHEGGTLFKSKKKFEYVLYKDKSEITNPGTKEKRKKKKKKKKEKKHYLFIILLELLKFMAHHSDECCVTMYPPHPLPSATTIQIQVGPNIPSLSGPLRNQNKYHFSFLTLSKFSVDSFIPVTTPKQRVNAGWIGKITFNTCV